MTSSGIPVPAALVLAARDLSRPAILWHAIWPAIVALAVWAGIAAAVWRPLGDRLLAVLPGWSWLDWAGPWLVNAGLVFAFAPLVYVTAVLLVATVSLPRMMNLVAIGQYPDVSRQSSAAAALWGSLANTLAAGAIFVAGWLVTLPLLLVPGALLVLPPFWAAWFNQRTFRFDAVAEHATAGERRRLVARDRSRYWLAGIACALAAHVPILNLLVPAYTALVFVHLGLGGLRALRREEGIAL
ncbi:MAG: EI24 domain-containing protein [Rhodocyclaceae bacterium]|nr:EI24 domain-containing protein [Rhodocyclaceae bacterium]